MEAGGEPVPVHIDELLHGQVDMTDFDALLLSGGFSYGDVIRSGAVLGRMLRERLADDINTLVERGSPVVGICNGFQVLVETGLLPSGTIDDAPKAVSLTRNQHGKFECDWARVKVGQSACKFLGPELVDSIQSLPYAHAEGRFVAPGQELPSSQIVLQFVDDEGNIANSRPHNPNGSTDGITAICDPSGVVLGMMPHPERALYNYQHKAWRSGEGQNPFGMRLFEGIVQHAKSL
jgi:phosphoribosylformylglycinamidine synthase